MTAKIKIHQHFLLACTCTYVYYYSDLLPYCQKGNVSCFVCLCVCVCTCVSVCVCVCVYLSVTMKLLYVFICMSKTMCCGVLGGVFKVLVMWLTLNTTAFPASWRAHANQKRYVAMASFRCVQRTCRSNNGSYNTTNLSVIIRTQWPSSRTSQLFCWPGTSTCTVLAHVILLPDCVIQCNEHAHALLWFTVRSSSSVVTVLYT